MTQEALKKMYQLLLTEPHSPTVCAQLESIAREALAEHAMQEVQRLGQEIEQAPWCTKMNGCKTKCDDCPDAPPQCTEQNFCPRCGKRTKDIHTCTPPKENT